MTAIAYPVTLPGPISAPLQSVERRLLSSLPGPRQSRALQRDRLAGQQVDFIFTNAQAAIFAAWVKNDLLAGGAWFSANWPQPQGGTGVRRFVGAPSYPQYMPTFGWRVSAVCEVRGKGRLPTDCINEMFSGGLSGYKPITGDAALFTIVGGPYGSALNVSSQSSGVEARIRRSFFSKAMTSLSVKFKITAINTDDGARLSVYGAGAPNVVFIPCRESAFDALRRPYLYVGADALTVADAALTVDDWYELDLTLVAGAGSSISTLTHLADGTVVQTVALATSHPPPASDSLDFSADSGGLTSPVLYSDIHIC